MLKQRTTHVDLFLLIGFAVLLCFGLLMLSSASAAVRLDDQYFFIKRQLLLGVLPGLLAFFVCLRIPPQFWKRAGPFLYVLMIALLIMVFLPGIGTDANTGTQSWIAIGSRYSVQPSEFAKLGIIIFLAGYMTKTGKSIQDLKQGFLVAVGLAMLPILLVILQPDIGTVAILFAIVFGMLFVSQAKFSHIALLALAGVIGLIIMIYAAPYRTQRLTTFLNPELDPQGIGYQISQAQVAIGSGGVFGLGYGRSRQKFQYLPEVHADSIFAVISEEMGFVISLGLVLLITAICIRGLKIAASMSDPFLRLLCAGIIMWFMAQSFLNIGSIVGIFPLTGVPLPFVSHGGTALMSAMAAVGILLSASRYKQIQRT